MDQMMLMGLMDQETSLGGPDPISRCRTRGKSLKTLRRREMSQARLGRTKG